MYTLSDQSPGAGATGPANIEPRTDGPRVPGGDWPEFMALSREDREYVQKHLQIFADLDAAPRGGLGKTAARISREVRAQAANPRGYSAQSLVRKYKLYRKGGRKQGADGRPAGPCFEPGDWRCLLDRYTNGGARLPEEFVAYLVRLWSETTRANDAWAGVYRRLKNDWLAGAEIPGYGTADEWYPSRGLARPRGHFIRCRDLPEGWSESNLWRHLRRALPRASMRRAAQGQVNRVRTDWAAQLLRDRSRLMPLQLVTIDDVRLDLQCRMFVDGKWQIVYADAIMAVDVATGYVLGYGVKGRAVRGADTEAGRAAGTRMSISGDDVRHLLLCMLRDHGLPPYQMTLLCEGATAKLNRPDEAAFLQMLAGRLEIDYTGMGRGRLLKSGFAEEWGRPNLKGWIESFFRLLHTSGNHLPGTAGRRFDLSRGDAPARVRYCEQLVRRAEKLIDGPLTPDHPLHAQLNFPILDMEEANHAVGEIVDQLNWRIDHRLQGFDRVWEYRYGGRWLPEPELTSVPAGERAELEPVPRMEAPAERLAKLCARVEGRFERPGPETLAALYMDHRTATVRGGRITISDTRLGVDRLVFAADGLHALDPYEGAKNGVLAYIAPDWSHAVLADASTGAHVATMRREGRVDVLDAGATGRRAGEVRREMEGELDHVRSYTAPMDDRLSRMRQDNEEALSRAAPEPEDTPLASRIARERRREDRRQDADRRAARVTDEQAEEFFGAASGRAAADEPEPDVDPGDLF